MIADILNNPFNNFYAVFFYWLPLLLNAVAYTLITWGRVQKDKAAVEKNEKYYNDFITIGTLVKYALATIVPVVNALALAFDAGPDLLKRLFRRFAWLFDVQLVRDRRQKEGQK